MDGARRLPRIQTIDRHASGIRRFQRGHTTQQRGLARPIGTHQRGDGMAGDRQADTSQRPMTGIFEDQVANFDHRRCYNPLSPKGQFKESFGVSLVFAARSGQKKAQIRGDSMRIAIIGTGYVGLVSGACLSEFGHDVICIDKDESKVETLRAGGIPIFEPGLDDVVAVNAKAGRLSFTTDLKTAVAEAEAVFIAVGTPSRRGDGHADLSYVFAAAEEIAEALSGYTVVVTKSTVPVGTSRKVEEIIRKKRPDVRFDMASNPEFLREGSALEDFRRPDRVVVGCDTEQAREVMREVYRPLYLNETPIVFTSRESSELIKYAANAFLATKITFINEMAAICEKVVGNVQDVARGIGLDDRIGGKFLHAGPGYGGSCFPKDTPALVQTAQELGAPTRIVEAVVAVNDARQISIARKIGAAVGGGQGKNIPVLGPTFQPQTHQKRESPPLVIPPPPPKTGGT